MLNMIVFLLIAIISVNASEEHILLNDNGVQHIEINQNHPQIQNNANQIALLNNFNEHEMVQNIHENPIALNQISQYRIKLTKDITIIIQDTGAHNGRQKCNYWHYLNYVLAIPNWVIPGLLTLNKAFIMAILQFVLRIPRDSFRGASIVNCFVSLGITVANSILLWQANEGEGTTIPIGEQIGFVIAVPVVLDVLRWLRWESESHDSKGHFDMQSTEPIVKQDNKDNADPGPAICISIILTNLFMPIVLQPHYYQILFGFGFFQWIRSLEIETVLLLFSANVTARCLAYNANPDSAQIWSIVGPFLFLLFILCCKD